jgi:protein-tyrosine phosphatase
MIDLHCHMLPGIDDGAPDLDTALAMARLAVDDGITLVACTPHIYPGLYPNTAGGIRAAIAEFRARLAEADIPLQITYGADTHMTPDLLARFRDGTIPTLHGTRYFLLEPPHHVAPPRLEEFVFTLVAAGYVPIITHPGRLTWIEGRFEIFRNLVRGGAWMQITAGSLTGRFGRAAQYWGEQFLEQRLVHILATDAHGVKSRAPLLAEGVRAAERWLGAEEALRCVRTRPQAVLANSPPESVTMPEAKTARAVPAMGSRIGRWFGKAMH